MDALGCKGLSLTLSQLADEYLDNWSGKDTNQAPRVLERYNLVDIVTLPKLEHIQIE